MTYYNIFDVEESERQLAEEAKKPKLFDYKDEPISETIVPALMVVGFILLSLWGIVHGSNSYGRYNADMHDVFDGG